MKLLFLTDHRHHRHFDSVYLLSRWASSLKGVDVFVASLGAPENADRLTNKCFESISAVRPSQNLDYVNRETVFSQDALNINTNAFDLVCLRVLPIDQQTLLKIKASFPVTKFINDIDGISRTESKEYLLNFAELCPAMQLCESIDHVTDFAARQPVVLKPLYGYGGAQNILLSKFACYQGNQAVSKKNLLNELADRFDQGQRYLAMEFLPDYQLGDRRILVVNGAVVGASLRVPQGGWLCNVSSGGKVLPTVLEAEEFEAVEIISERLNKEGIAIFGIDTLQGSNGKRLVTEINTCCAGGFYSIHHVLKDKNIAKKTTREINRLLENYA